MSGIKDALINKNSEINESVFISKKMNKNENQIKFIIKKKLLFNIEKISSDSNKKITNGGRWSNEEHDKFLNGLALYGIKWKKFRNIINTRTLTQIRAHAQKFYLKMKLCKNENLGIDFTLNSIQNIKDMINQIKSNDNNYNVVNIFKYLNNKINEESKKRKIDNQIKIEYQHDNDNEINLNNELENTKYENMFNIENNFILDSINNNFFFGHFFGINDFLDNKEELSLEEEIKLPLQFYSDIFYK